MKILCKNTIFLRYTSIYREKVCPFEPKNRSFVFLKEEKVGKRVATASEVVTVDVLEDIGNEYPGVKVRSNGKETRMAVEEIDGMTVGTEFLRPERVIRHRPERVFLAPLRHLPELIDTESGRQRTAEERGHQREKEKTAFLLVGRACNIAHQFIKRVELVFDTLLHVLAVTIGRGGIGTDDIPIDA